MIRMRVSTAVVVMALVIIIATVSLAAGPKQYQFTGAVTEIDAKARTISVDKGGDNTKVKKGDKVTVYYQMAAKKIESK